MTERELDQRIEQWAGQLEERLERGAGRFERGLMTAWEERPAFRRLCRGLSLAAGAGLLGGAFHLLHAGRRAWALWCALAGTAAILWELVSPLLFRRKP